MLQSIHTGHTRRLLSCLICIALIIGIGSAILFGFESSKNLPTPTAPQNNPLLPASRLKPVHAPALNPSTASALQTGKQIAANWEKWNTSHTAASSNLTGDLSSLPISQQRAIEQTMDVLGANARLRMDDESKTLRYLEGDLQKIASSSTAYRQARDRGDFGEQAVALAGELASVLNLKNPANELIVERIRQDEQGMTHVRLNQTYRDIPIWGAQIAVHFNAEQNPILLTGVYTSTPDMPEPVETISPETALALARSAIQAQPSSDADLLLPRVQRMIYWDLGRQPVYCWNVELAPDYNQAWEIFLDCADGGVVHRYDKITTEAVMGLAPDLKGAARSMPCWKDQEKYYAINTTLAMYNPTLSTPPYVTKLRGAMYLLDFANQDPSKSYSLKDVATAQVNEWQPAAVSVMNNLMTTENYYRSTFSLNSLDNSGMNIWAVLHWRWQSGGGSTSDNACWNQTVRCMQFGDGESIAAGLLPHALDIVAHEYTHGVTSYAANLIYENQSGAIDEALSDFFACMIDRDDWWVGEDIVAYGGKKAFRDVGNPQNSDMVYRLPASMANFMSMPISNDHGGVHYNMSICAYAGYLLAEGLDGGITKEKAEKIFHRARLYYLTQRSQFTDFRRACQTAARDLFGENSAEAAATQKAFDAVGVEESDLIQVSTPGTPTVGEGAILYLAAEESAGWDEYHDGYFCRLYMKKGDSNALAAQRIVGNTLPGVSGDGRTLFYVGDDKNLYVSDGASEQRLTDSGLIRTISVSKDLRTIAYSTIQFDSYIYLLDLNTGSVSAALLSVPMPDASPQNLQYCDVMSFNFRGDYLYFDAVSEMKLASGESFLSWGIYGMRIADHRLFMVVAQSANEQIGNPIMSNTLDQRMVADRVVYDESNKYHLEAVSIDFNQGRVSPLLSALSRFGQPCFDGGDERIILRDLNKVQQRYYLYQAALSEDKFSLSSEPEAILSSSSAISHPYGFRIGEYQIQKGQLEAPDSVVFGLAQINQIVKRSITLTNTGNADLQILGVTLEGDHPDWFLHNANNQILAPNESATFQVICQPTGVGELKTRLVIFSTDPNQKNITVELNGEARGGGVPTPEASPTPSPTSLPEQTPTPTAKPTPPPFVPSLVYEFDHSSLAEDGWSVIPGGFTGAPAGAVEPTNLPETFIPSSQDRRGLAIQTLPGQVAFLYASKPIDAGGKPMLLRLTLRADAPGGAVTLAALKNGLAQADGSIAFNTQTSTDSLIGGEGVVTLLYEADTLTPITPVIQLAGGAESVTIWVDRLEALILENSASYSGAWFYADPSLNPGAVAQQVYAFDQPTFEQNGWQSIPGGFTGAPNGAVSSVALDETIFPSSHDKMGLQLTVDPDQVAFIFAAQSFQTNGAPALLRLTLRSNSENAAIAVGALKGPIAQTDGSISVTIPHSASFAVEEPGRLVTLYQPAGASEISPFIQAANTGSTPATLWVDRLEIMALNNQTTYTGKEFFAKPQSTGLPSSITIPLEGLNLAAKPLQMVFVPAGTFQMGSPADEIGRSDTDELAHRITLTRPFYISRFEIIQAQWTAVMGDANPNISIDLTNKKNNPVLNMTWFEAAQFCNQLSRLQGLTPVYDETSGNANLDADGFRLPIEAEWERACRAGSSTRFFWGNDAGESQYVTYARCASESELGVGFPRLSNSMGLWDANGNAAEWCQNWFYAPGASTYTPEEIDPTGPNAGTERVLRGGGFSDALKNCRSASRRGADPAVRQPSAGFRIVKPAGD